MSWDLSPRGSGRLVIALAVIVASALLVWGTMDPGRFRYAAWAMLGFSAFRVVILRFGSGYSIRGSLSRRTENQA